MKNKNIWILTLVGLVLGSTFNNSYAQDGAIVINEQKEVRVEPLKIYGAAGFEIAHNFMLQGPVKTNFVPSLITMKKTSNSELVNAITFDTSVKLGFETNFHVEDKVTRGILEFAADSKDVKLRRMFFESGAWSVGLKETNFCNVAAFGAVRTILVGYTKELNSNMLLGISVEQGKNYELHPTSKEDAIKKSHLKPRGDVPAASARFQYQFDDKFGCIEVSGLARPLGIYDRNARNTEFYWGYGVNLGSELNLVDETDKIVVNATFGQAIGSYIRDFKEMAEIEENDAYVRKVDSQVNLLMILGAHLSYEHNFNPSLSGILGGGMSTTLDEKENKSTRADAYLMGFYANGKLMYHPTKKTSFGIEYSWGMRTNINETSATANHLKALAEFTF